MKPRELLSRAVVHCLYCAKLIAMSHSAQDPEPSWKKLKLSFERPYTDDAGKRIPVLYDLTPEGERIYEQ